MAVVRAFKAIRPVPGLAARVAALPYDVMNSEEAREAVKGNPYSFLHVDKAEIDLPADVDPYDSSVYAKARENLDRMKNDGVLVQDGNDCLYIYRLTMDGRSQTGIVGCTSIDDYIANTIRKHENTRADKELDRITHVDRCDANTGPIFLTYKSREEINTAVDAWIAGHAPVYDFVADDGIGHAVWVIDDDAVIGRLREAFAEMSTLYIADGHHRAASAVKVGSKRRAAAPGFTGGEEFNFFLSVLFPDDQLKILDYNRLVKDLNGNTPEGFISKLGAKFDVEKYAGAGPFRPDNKHVFGMYLDGAWYKLAAKPGTFDESDPVAQLDVSILQNNLLAPILDIWDPRTDKRIDFVGGIRGLKELERRVRSGMKAAFALYPTSIGELMTIADAGEIMPPKSTWFEPKLRSGLFIHDLS